MKRFLKWQVLVLAITAIVFSGSFACSMKAAEKKDAATEQTVTDISDETGETVSEDETENEEPPLAFVKTKKKLRCGKAFRFTTNRQDVIWSVSNTKKAKISSKGKLRAKRYGKVTVTATSGDESISFDVKLVPKKVIGIDPGHQLYGDSGTEPVGPGSSTKKAKVAGGTSGVSTKKPEHQLTLEIGLALKSELVKRGYKVVMTRKEADVNVTNIERAKKLNKSCDVAIRLHADGAGPSAKGASVLYPSANNPYVANLSAASEKLSKCVIESYCNSTGIKNRGLSKRDDLTGTNWSTIPVTLLEMGFMTNTSDDNYMSSAEGQKQMVKGIADGIDEYFK